MVTGISTSNQANLPLTVREQRPQRSSKSTTTNASRDIDAGVSYTPLKLPKQIIDTMTRSTQLKDCKN
jgi:hypothetical protein